MYRALSNGLMSAGWALVNSPDIEPDAWTRFTTATDTAKASYNATYQRAVILAAEPKPDDQQQQQKQQQQQEQPSSLSRRQHRSAPGHPEAHSLHLTRHDSRLSWSRRGWTRSRAGSRRSPRSPWEVAGDRHRLARLDRMMSGVPAAVQGC
jgi:hypothetical protein